VRGEKGGDENLGAAKGQGSYHGGMKNDLAGMVYLLLGTSFPDSWMRERGLKVIEEGSMVVGRSGLGHRREGVGGEVTEDRQVWVNKIEKKGAQRSWDWAHTYSRDKSRGGGGGGGQKCVKQSDP